MSFLIGIFVGMLITVIVGYLGFKAGINELNKKYDN